MAKKKAKTKTASAKHDRTRSSSHLQAKSQKPTAKSAEPDADLRTYTIRDYRLEKPTFTLHQVRAGDTLRYEVKSGDLSTPAPPIRESKYLSREQCIEIYRWMLLNRRMETALENLYKQGQVVGGVYFGLGQEACSCASAYALHKDDWLGPMIRNQGSLLVRGFSPADVMMQYMAKAGSPTKGRDASSHFGDIEERNVVSPISTLGDLIPVLAGVALGARLQGKHIAVMTYIGDGGQSTGVTYEGVNFAAVQKLGLVLIVENNLWAYSTPADMQFRVKDLAERAIAYGIPAEYVPKALFEYWKRRDPIARFEDYLVKRKKWLSPVENEKLIADVERQLEADRELAVNSPMPAPESAAGGVYCEAGCHEIKPKYAMPGSAPRKARGRKPASPKPSEPAIHLK